MLTNREILGLGLALFLGGCIVSAPNTPFLPPGPVTALPPTPTLALSPYGWSDENALVSGICFQAAYDAAGRVFVLRDAEAHIRFYALADQSGLCRRPAARHPFDFSGGRVVAGLWSRGRGCEARHDVLEARRDDSAKTLLIVLRFVTEGTCDYTLVRPFWVGLEAAADYQIDIQVAE